MTIYEVMQVLIILSKYFDDIDKCYLNAEHDVLCIPKTDKDITEIDLKTLDEIGAYFDTSLDVWVLYI